MSAVIGALRVTLGIDTAAFSAGLQQAQSRLAAAGKSMQSAGQALSARVTAPIAAAAAAIGLGVSRVAGNLVELGNQAQLANTDVETFQKWAYGAKTVGIEQAKLADILKDVNDKVGDFQATGGGEMAAFFENIAPKVGITAEAFRDLPGADALQLYVSSLEKAGVSQAEMVFYMESIGDEASGLIPLLAKNGAEMDRQGEAAARFGLKSEKSIESARRFQDAMKGLNDAISAMGTAFVEAGVLDFLTQIAERVTNWVAALNQANPQLTKFVLIGGAIAAAIGPALVVLGLAVTAIGAIGAPVLLAVAAIALLTGAAVALYANWDRIKAQFPAIAGVVENVGAALGTLAGGAIEQVKLMAQGLEQLLSGDFRGAANTLVQIVQNAGETISFAIGAALGFSREEVLGFAQVVSDQVVRVGTAVGDFVVLVGQKFAELDAYLAGLRDKFVAIGKDVIDGLLAGLREKWESVRAWFGDLGASIPQWVRDALGIRSPSTVFAEIGANIMQGLQQGLGAESGGIRAEMENFAQGLGQIFAGVILQKQKLGESLREFGLQTLGNIGGGLLNAGFGGLAGALRIPGFANGTGFAPGGMAWVGERGKELVNLPRGAQVIPHAESMAMLRGGRAEPQAIRVYVDDDDKLRAMVDRRAGAQVQRAQPATVRSAVGAVRKGDAASRHFWAR